MLGRPCSNGQYVRPDSDRFCHAKGSEQHAYPSQFHAIAQPVIHIRAERCASVVRPLRDARDLVSHLHCAFLIARMGTISTLHVDRMLSSRDETSEGWIEGRETAFCQCIVNNGVP
jgi:hypothetical protein